MQNPEKPIAAAMDLLRMPQLAEMQHPEDDWTGITKSADRRKRQNRLNQRAYRKRRQLDQLHVINPPLDPACPPTQECIPHDSKIRDGYILLHVSRKRDMTFAFMQDAYMHYTLNSPEPTYLPSLIRLNALNAVSHNATVLGFSKENLCRDDLISPFNYPDPKAPTEPHVPESLRPTTLQRSIHHHPWTDLFPLPRFRDNILRAMISGTLDEDELCLDLLEVVNGDTSANAFLIVWGQPWDITGWEVSPGFLRKWGWLLEGCPEAIEATNRWRETRGESKLNINLDSRPDTHP